MRTKTPSSTLIKNTGKRQRNLKTGRGRNTVTMQPTFDFKSLRSPLKTRAGLKLGLLGRHQASNAALAVAASRAWCADALGVDPACSHGSLMISRIMNSTGCRAQQPQVRLRDEVIEFRMTPKMQRAASKYNGQCRPRRYEHHSPAELAKKNILSGVVISRLVAIPS